MAKRTVLIVLLVLVAGGSLWWLLHRPSTLESFITASGTIEAEEVSIAAEVGGRIAALLRDEGDEVKPGQVLIQLDSSLLQAERKQGEAGLELARAAWGEEARHLRTSLEQARAAEEGTRQAWMDAKALRENPQELETQVLAAQSQLAVAERNLKFAGASEQGAKQAWMDAKALRDNPQELETQVIAAQTQLAVAERNLKLAGAAEEGARQAWMDTKAVRENPQELESQILVAQSQLAVAKRKLELAIASRTVTTPELEVARDGAQQTLEYLLEMKKNPLSLEAALNQAKASYDKSQVSTQAAEVTRDGAQQTLKHLLEMKKNPLSLEAALNRAKAAYDQAMIAVQATQANLRALYGEGTSVEESSVARANVRHAEASLELLRVRLEKMTIRSPLEGLVTARSIQVGEMAFPGVSLMTVANIDKVKLTIYIPEKEVGHVVLGHQVEVMVDSFPGRVFLGRTVYISPRVEFTPRNVQTQKERTTTVFAARVEIDNPGHMLKPGMPADASIGIAAR